MDNCTFDCMNPDSASCEACRLEHCGDDFEACAGMPMQ
jgi:hypothetical protein